MNLVEEIHNDSDEEINNDSDEEIDMYVYMNSIPLYKNCEYIFTSLDENLFIYSPKNELDNDLFNSLINSELLKKEYIKISEEMYPIFIHAEVFSLGKLNIWNYYSNSNYNNYCYECKLFLPIDLHFYSNKLCEEIENEYIYNKQKILNDKYNLCRECYKINKKDNLNLVKVSTGFDNISDWISIFNINMEQEYYCNLNKKSLYYKKFAEQSYIDMLGDEVNIINETSLEEIFASNK